MPGTVKSGLLPDADRLHKCDGQEKVCKLQHLPLDKSHFITDLYSFIAFGCIMWSFSAAYSLRLEN